MLRTDIRARYDTDGFAVIERALTPDEVESLRRDATKICRGEYGTLRGLTRRLPPSPTTRCSSGTSASTSRTRCRR